MRGNTARSGDHHLGPCNLNQPVVKPV